MRLAILIAVLAVDFVSSRAGADEPLAKVLIDGRPAYIVSENYASSHEADFIESLPYHVEKIDFWTPTEVDVLLAEKTFRELLQDGAKDVSLVFPDLVANPDDYPPEALSDEKAELDLVNANYQNYVRQYVGMMIDDRKFIYCNYSACREGDPATEYIFVQKFFTKDEGAHFLQGEFDYEEKTCSKISFIGPWRPPEKGENGRN